MRECFSKLTVPTNIYNDPTNLFVAGFIGAPPMNLIHGEIESGKFFAEGCLINNVDKDSKKDVILGIRPEDMEIVQKGTSHLEATLYSIELTGDFTFIAVTFFKCEIAGFYGFRKKNTVL